jgi:hypothetical protein
MPGDTHDGVRSRKIQVLHQLVELSTFGKIQIPNKDEKSKLQSLDNIKIRMAKEERVADFSYELYFADMN